MYQFRQKVLFKHCDPAGIVFYPRYFEMINDAVEALFTDRFDWPFETLHRNQAVPTARVTVDFKAPSRHGDWLDFQLVITKLGASSMELSMMVLCGEDLRLTVDQVLVLVNDQGRPTGWPDPFRSKVKHIMEEVA